jgi:hypothetical protein
MNTANDGGNANQVAQHEDPVKNTGQFVQHIAYWYKDGSVVVRVWVLAPVGSMALISLQVDNSTIFKIHLSLFTRLSDVLRTILSIPDGKAPDDPTREGTSLYPLFLPGTNVAEFTDFLFWLYRT